METTLPFPNRRTSRSPGPGQGRPSTRRRPTRQAARRPDGRPTHRLDARTRQIGLAGVASARLVLAACRPVTGGLPGSADPHPTGTDDLAGGLPVGDTHRAHLEAA
ncbi:MAG: hypothetical protein OSA36_08430 [Acidimicrobiales bacterium]|nr:hypothetical protein [Acidimicrobiales bacterium]